MYRSNKSASMQREVIKVVRKNHEVKAAAVSGELWIITNEKLMILSKLVSYGGQIADAI